MRSLIAFYIKNDRINMLEISSTQAYLDWPKECDKRTRAMIDSRLLRIRHFGHFGDVKHLGESLSELR